MRTHIYFLAAVLMTLTAACGDSFDIEKEKKAIIKVINQETEAYLDRDFETLFDTHVQDSLNMRLTAGADGFLFLEGWDEISRHLSSDATEDDLGPDLHINVEKSNYRMKVYPSSAFVVCDQLWSYSIGGEVIDISSIQVRFLEKIDGEWKISFVSFIGTSGYDEDEDIEVLED